MGTKLSRKGRSVTVATRLINLVRKINAVLAAREVTLKTKDVHESPGKHAGVVPETIFGSIIPFILSFLCSFVLTLGFGAFLPLVLVLCSLLVPSFLRFFRGGRTRSDK